jgi:hypothetical protein
MMYGVFCAGKIPGVKFDLARFSAGPCPDSDFFVARR